MNTEVDDPVARGYRVKAWSLHALALVAGTLLALARVGGAGFHGIVWAEDGAVFLSAEYADGRVRTLWAPYAGYGHLVPRLVTDVVTLLPVAWHGLGMVIAAAMIQTAVAILAFHVVRSHGSGVVAPTLAALAVIAVPVGTETAANVANLQWFLLYGGTMAALWVPRRRGGQVASVVAVVALAMSCPFGGVAVAVAAVTWWRERSRATLVRLVLGAGGYAAELLVMWAAPPRVGLHHELNVRTLVVGYVERVLADGVFGVGAHTAGTPAGNWPVGLGVGFVLLVVAGVVAVRSGRAALQFPAVLLVLSVATYLAPVVLSGSDVAYPFNDSRYYVAPVLFLLTSVGVMLARLNVGRPALTVSRLAPAVLTCVVLGSVAYGLVTSFTQPRAGRDEGPSWGESARMLRPTCEAAGAPRTVSLPIEPSGWSVRVPCSELR